MKIGYWSKKKDMFQKLEDCGMTILFFPLQPSTTPKLQV